MVVTNEEAKANDPKRTSFNRKRGGYASEIVCWRASPAGEIQVTCFYTCGLINLEKRLLSVPAKCRFNRSAFVQLIRSEPETSRKS